jgi:hypothetical protein
VATTGRSRSPLARLRLVAAMGPEKGGRIRDHHDFLPAAKKSFLPLAIFFHK